MYSYKQEEDLTTAIYNGTQRVAIMDDSLEFPGGVAEGICNALNKQDKYILPMQHKGGGFVRKLTDKEIQQQQEQQRIAWGLTREEYARVMISKEKRSD